MANSYIDSYIKSVTKGEKTLQAVLGALYALKNERQDWLDQQTAGIKLSRRHLFKDLFFNKSVTEENVGELSKMIVTLENLSSTDPQSITNILSQYFKKISPKGQTYELLLYIIKNLESINYNIRPSATIEPAPLNILLGESEAYNDGMEWQDDLSKIIKKKNLPKNLFRNKNSHLNLESDISKHVAWAYEHIYKFPYPPHEEFVEAKASGIHRYFHGIAHVTRATAYVPVIANLYKKHGDQAANNLTKDDIKLLQIAALFHDSAREDEGEDKWDHESAVFLYYYLTQVLNIADKAKAKLLAEAIANKDPSKNGYFEIHEKNGIITWSWNKILTPEKNIYQKIIHDADCLDIIRARDSFDASYLDFYKDIASRNKEALEEMAILITEARSLIEVQGDSRNRTKPEIKKRYDKPNAYELIVNDIKKYKVLSELSAPTDLNTLILVDQTPFCTDLGLTEQNVAAALNEGKVFARGVATPSARTKKRDISCSQYEIAKTMREKGIATNTDKANRTEKVGNPVRSVSMIGYGSSVFTNAGFLIINPDINAISKINAVDVGTGRGKKVAFKQIEEPLTAEQKHKQLMDLHTRLKLGGTTTTFKGFEGYASGHVEILYSIKKYDAIFFSPDPNLYNVDAYASPEPTHRYSAVLQAIFLQKDYESQYDEFKKKYVEKFGEKEGTKLFLERHGYDRTLPIFEYSGINNKIIKHGAYSDDDIIQMWASMTYDFIKAELGDKNSLIAKDIAQMKVKDLKVYCMYKTKSNNYARENIPADNNYPVVLQDKISEAIEEARQNAINFYEQQLLKELNDNPHSIFSDKIFFYLAEINSSLFNPLKKVIANEIEKKLQQDSNLFLDRPIEQFSVKYSRVEHLFPDKHYKKIKIKNFETNAARIYVIAEKLGLQNYEHLIRQKAQKLAQDSINDLRKNGLADKTKHHNIFMNMNYILNFTRFFRLDDVIKMVNRIIDNLFNDFSASTIREKTLQNYKDEIAFLFDNKLEQPKHLTAIQAVIESLKKEIAVNPTSFNLNDLANYVIISKFIKKDFKPVLMRWMDNPSVYWEIDQKFFISQIGHLLTAENDDIFQRIIQQTSRVQDAWYISTWVEEVESFEVFLPGRKYSTLQWKIIANEWETLCAKFIENLKSRLHVSNMSIFKTLIYELSPRLNFNPLMHSNYITHFFNDTLNKLTDLEFEGFDERTKQRVLKLHEILPYKDKRITSVERLENVHKTVLSSYFKNL